MPGDGRRGAWAPKGASAVSDPAFEITSVNHAQDEDDAVPVENVVHDPVVADPQPVERIVRAANRFYGLPLDSADPGCVTCKLLEGPRDSSANLSIELPERLGCGGAELDAIRVQVRSGRT